MALITRQGKGSRLTIEELDSNFTYLESLTGSLENRLDTLAVESGSIRSTLNSFTSSVNSTQTVLAGRLDTLEIESGSIRSTFNSFTSSNNTRLDTLENDTFLSQSVAEIVTGIDVRILALEDQGVATAEVPGTMSTTDKIKLDGIQAGAEVNITNNLSITGTISSFNSLIGTPSSDVIEYSVTVVIKTSNHRYFGTGSASGYHINGIESPFLTLLPGKTYRFLQSDASNNSHQIRFYLQADKTTQFTTNVTFNETAGSAGSYTQIIVTDSTPIVLHYQCVNHGYMGNSAQFNSNAIDTPYLINARNGITSTGQLSIKGYSETIFTLTDAATVTPVVSNGSIQNWTLGANRTLSTASLNAGESLMLIIGTGGVSRSITWSTVSWMGGSAPTLQSSGVNVIELWKVGSTTYGALVGKS